MLRQTHWTNLSVSIGTWYWVSWRSTNMKTSYEIVILCAATAYSKSRWLQYFCGVLQAGLHLGYEQKHKHRHKEARTWRRSSDYLIFTNELVSSFGACVMEPNGTDWSRLLLRTGNCPVSDRSFTISKNARARRFRRAEDETDEAWGETHGKVGENARDSWFRWQLDRGRATQNKTMWGLMKGKHRGNCLGLVENSLDNNHDPFLIRPIEALAQIFFVSIWTLFRGKRISGLRAVIKTAILV